MRFRCNSCVLVVVALVLFLIVSHQRRLLLPYEPLHESLSLLLSPLSALLQLLLLLPGSSDLLPPVEQLRQRLLSVQRIRSSDLLLLVSQALPSGLRYPLVQAVACSLSPSRAMSTQTTPSEHFLCLGFHLNALIQQPAPHREDPTLGLQELLLLPQSVAQRCRLLVLYCQALDLGFNGADITAKYAFAVAALPCSCFVLVIFCSGSDRLLELSRCLHLLESALALVHFLQRTVHFRGGFAAIVEFAWGHHRRAIS